MSSCTTPYPSPHILLMIVSHRNGLGTGLQVQERPSCESSVLDHAQAPGVLLEVTKRIRLVSHMYKHRCHRSSIVLVLPVILATSVVFWTSLILIKTPKNKPKHIHTSKQTLPRIEIEYYDFCLLWNDEAKANIKPIYECRCNGRLQTKRSTRLSHTGLVVELEDLKIKTRLTNEKFASVKGECEI
jgi:hypothetical protein